MGESASPPPSTSRRGPPPIPRGVVDPGSEPNALAQNDGALDDLLALCTAEAESTSTTIDRRRSADLRVRAAMMTWDARGDRGRALSLLEGVDHPAASTVRLAAALDSDEPALLGGVISDAKKRGDKNELADLGGLILWRGRGGSAPLALELLKLAGEDAQAARRLALAMAAQWGPLCDALSDTHADRVSLVEAACVAQDRLSDVPRALKLLSRAFKMSAGKEPQSSTAYLIERLLELTEMPTEFLRAKLEVLGAEVRTAVDRAATMYMLATALENGGGRSEAAELVAQLAEATPPFGPILVLRARARLEASRGEWARAAEAWEQLAQLTAGPPWIHAYQRRAAEIWEARAGDPQRAEALYAALHKNEPSEAAVARALARLRIARGAVGEAAQVLEQCGRALGDAGAQWVLLAARSSAEDGRSGSASTLKLWREMAADRYSLEALARIYRAVGDTPALVAVYRKLGALSGEKRDDAEPPSPTRMPASAETRRGAAYLAVAGALALDAGLVGESEAAFNEATEREPDDLLCHAGRVALFRRTGKFAELKGALHSLIGFVRSKEGQARLYLQAARVSAEQLNDPLGAQESYEKALELKPDDVTTLHAFAKLLGDTGKWQRAVEMREKAAKALPNTKEAGTRAASLLCEVGEIYEKRLQEDENARKSYERALSRDERCTPALGALAALHRKHNRVHELLDVLRIELKFASDKARQLELHLEIGNAAEHPKDGDLKLALASYRDALRVDPAHAAALVGMERLCRREGEWELLAEVMRRAPRSVRTLRTLAESLEHLERWEELAEAREAELQLLAEPREIARLGRALAELYERRLEDLDAAARAWHRVDEADPRDPHSARALQRIYEARGRFADLAAAIERELQIGDATDSGGKVTMSIEPERRLELWLKLGEIRRGRLSRPESAAEAYEHALEIDNKNGDALAALAEIYSASKRGEDLNRVLDMRAAATDDPQQRASVLQQKGDLLERNGDLDAALAAYAEAFKLDPASRTCFTAYERVCYRREKWRQAMELYETAIRLVEVQRSRAYRLADLYARRGQLQLQYLGQPGEAAASYLRVLELDPESDTAQSALERIFSAQADWHGLIGAYERRAELVRDDQKRVEVLRRAARVAAAKQKDAQEASRLYQRLHSVDPTDGEALDALERHYERTRDWEKLVGILTTRLSLTAGGDEAIALYLRIAHMCEEGLHDAARAIEAYRKILDIAPNQKEAIDALGRLYEGTERWAELVEVTRRQIRIVNDRATKALLYFKCGSVMESKFAKEDDAIRYYDAAIKTSPSCLPAVHGLRDLYLRREDWPRVIQTLELEAKLWTDDKERAGVFAHIGQIYGDKLGDRERAIQYYESALTVDRECLPANRALFELYFARQDFQRALPVAVILTQKVTREGDPVERSEFYRKRAIVADKTGDRRASAESLVVALEIRPENMEALDLLVQLCRSSPDAYDFPSTFRELDKLYRKREFSAALARCLIAQGSLSEKEYDIEGAETLYLEAFKMAPDQFRVVEALVALHERLRRFDAGAAVLEAFVERAPSEATRALARYRLAELLGDGAMDPARAAETLEELVQENPDHRDGWFRLAQELYLLGRYSEAHRACERLIALSAAPGHTVPPEELARYYDYLGRIAEASGDVHGAVRAYRRAIDLDPSYPPAALSLARRAVATGDRMSATAIIDTALQAAELRGSQVDLALRRGLARFYVALDDRGRAIESYRTVLMRAPDGPEQLDDRVALAELLAASEATLPSSREELLTVLSADLKHVPAYRLLMQVYQKSGDLDRVARVASMLTVLGFAEPTDRPPPHRANVKRGTLSDDLRRMRLVPPPVQGAFTDALLAVRLELAALYPPPPIGTAIPAAQVPDPGFKVCVVDAQRLFGVNAEVFVSDVVPGNVMLLDDPQPMVILQAGLVDQPDTERRFLLGRAFEPLRGGYGLVMRLRGAERAQLGHLLEQLIRPDGERDAASQEFVRGLPRKAQKAVEKLAGTAAGATVEGWYAALQLASDRAGLLACDDVGAAARTLARLSGDELALMSLNAGALAGGGHHEPHGHGPHGHGPHGHGPHGSGTGALALGQVPGVAELVRFFLSDAYHELRTTLGDPSGRL